MCTSARVSWRAYLSTLSHTSPRFQFLDLRRRIWQQLPGEADILRTGIGFPRKISSVRNLKPGLNPRVVPHESADEHPRVSGYGATLHPTFSDDYSHLIAGGAGRPHRSTGHSCGTFVGPDGAHETNHSEECTRKYAGLSQCQELDSLNLNVHSQNYAKWASACGLSTKHELHPLHPFSTDHKRGPKRAVQ